MLLGPHTSTTCTRDLLSPAGGFSYLGGAFLLSNYFYKKSPNNMAFLAIDKVVYCGV